MNNLIGKIVDIHYCEENNQGIIRIFIRTIDKQSIILRFNFNSFCYVYVDDDKKIAFANANKKLKNKASCSFITAKGYNGFNDQQQEYIKCEFKCDSNLKKWINNKIIKDLNLVFYESDIDPKLRFIHLTHVDPSGYICVPLSDYTVSNEYIYNKNDIPNLYYESKQDIPLLITSFDIECDSITGNFPLAEKSITQFFSDVFSWFNSCLFSKSIFKNCIFKNRNNKNEQYKHWKLLMDILLSEDYFKMSIGASSMKLVNNDVECEKAKEYMLSVFENTTNPDIINEVKTVLDNSIIPAIRKTLEITNLRTYKQLINVAVKILKSGLPLIDIDAISYKNPKNFSKITEDILRPIFDVGFDNNFTWKLSASAVTQYISKISNPDGDQVIQIGTVSQWSNDKFPCEKAIFMLGDCESFNNSDLIDLENNDLQKEHTTTFPQKEIDLFFKQHDIPFPNPRSYEVELATMKEYELTYQHKHDNAKVFINVFTTDVPVYKPIIKIIAKYLNKFKSSETFAKCCTTVKKYQMNTLEGVLTSSLSICQEVCDEIGRTYNCNIVYNNQKVIDIIMYVQNYIAGENITYVWGGERELLDSWRQYVNKVNPDVITGYNIFSFDYTYMYKRANYLHIDDFGKMSRLQNHNATKLTELSLSSSALGDNILRFPDVPGRVLIDMYKFIQKDYALDSYKLDDVSTLFLYKEKANVPPQEIFKKQYGSNRDRMDVAMYCILDCILPINLMLKLDVIQKNAAMSNVCKVPMNFLFTRGQGIKLFSLILYYAHNIFPGDMLLINTKTGKSESTGYEGAIVFEPMKGFHTTPTAVGDFNSLYPNSMIARNISHDTIIDSASPFALEDGSPDFEKLDKFGYKTFTVEYDDNVFLDNKYLNDDGTLNKDLVAQDFDIEKVTYVKDKGWRGTILKKCTYVQADSYRAGLLPEILKMLLKARKDIRKKIAVETDPFHKNVLDTMQLAYKITANSLYGQTGAATSKIFRKEVAASTTAIGRSMVLTARRVFESLAGQCIDIPDRYDNSRKVKVYIKSAETRAGDTDSCMTSWLCFWDAEYTQQLDELDAIWACMNICKYGCDIINSQVPPPEHIEFEKVICPFAIFAKKRYHGHYYVDGAYDDPYNPKFFAKSMGIVLKRRDNAHLLKDIYSKCLGVLMKERDIDKAFMVLDNELQNLDKRDMSDFVITKTLKTSYKLDNVAHVMLANRQAQRDPGNRFETNDRIPFIYFYSPAHNSKTLQGDRIETPEYMEKYSYTIDYCYYIDKQLKKPLGQIFCDLLDQTDRFETIIKRAMDHYKVNTVTKRTYRIDIDHQSDDECICYTCKFS